MMHLFFNGLAASAGGGLTYLRNVVPQISARSDVKATLAVLPLLRKELGDPLNISWVEMETPAGAVHRFWSEQTVLPHLIRRSGANVLISTGNIALRRSPVPQILLSRNSLYTSPDFFHDLGQRGEYALWLDARLQGILAKRSILWADCTVAPSQAFADDLRRWTGVNVAAIHHGFDRGAFFRHGSPLPALAQQRLDAAADSLRLLFVSNYTYYRNFETLIRALPLLKKALSPRKVRLLLTCQLRSEANPGNYHAEAAANLVRELDLLDEVVELGAIPYGSLHHLYRACNIYVTPAYAETFAHPLVEAMSCGLPVAASDLPVHREVCGAAALYFQRFSPEELAERVMEIAGSSDLAARMSAAGKVRSEDFSWSKHVDQLLSLADQLLGGRVNARRS